jgi:hypothetical protein
VGNGCSPLRISQLHVIAQMALSDPKWHAQSLCLHEVKNVCTKHYVATSTHVHTNTRSALDIDPKGTHVLIAQSIGCSILINISQGDGKGNVEQAYSVKEPEMPGAVSYEFGALFVRHGAALLYGIVQGCILVWDRSSGEIVHGFYQGEGTFQNTFPFLPNNS